ncbi:MAG: hypothetical protein AAF236_05475 [Verrucomicrobiota bacterium]
MSAKVDSAEKKVVGKPPPLPHVRSFRRDLGRALYAWKAGLFRVELLKIALIAVIAAASLLVIDFYLALPSAVRVVLLILGGLAAFTALGLAWTSIRRLTLADVARRIDQLGKSARHPVLSAHELLSTTSTTSPDSQGGLTRFLIDRSIITANATLSAVPLGSVRPKEKLRPAWSRLLIALAILAVVAALCWPIASVLFSRLALPWRDIPPYSPLEFVITPATPEVHYGDDAAIEVAITGSSIDHPVRFLSRAIDSEDDAVFETLCFQDGPDRYAQRLERVVRPTEFAIAVGKARSRWHSIDLLLEPKVALASVTVTPPRYAGQTPQTFLIGEKPLASLRGSTVALTVTSNRPLNDGEITLTPTDAPEGASRGILGRRSGTQSIEFEWELEEEAELEVVIRDVRGTANRDLLAINQRLVPDKSPTLELEKPPLHLMATPSISVPIQISATDDLGLSRVEMVRTVVGYRDRSEQIGPGMNTLTKRRFDFKSGLDLLDLGVRPGETLELYFQATDHNPSLLGVASSEMARIQIISDEEYADIIRTRTTLREFSERYRVMNRTLDELREKLEKLQEAIDSEDAEAIAAAREEAAAAARVAEDLFSKLAQDFAAFDLERETLERATEMSQQLERIGDRLAPDADPASAEEIQQMLADLGQSKEPFREDQAQAEEAEAVARLMQKAVEFSRLAQEQDTLARRLKRFEAETRATDQPLLDSLGESQDQIADSLRDFTREMREAIQELPVGYEDLAESARQFMNQVIDSGAREDMGTSTTAAGNEDGSRSFQYSSLAAEKLQAILEGEGENASEFGQLANGTIPFNMPGSLKKTLSEMLSALCLGMRLGDGNGPGNRPGTGRGGGGGAGGGYGGNSDDGFAVAGYTALDIPVLGPTRMRLQDIPSSRMGDEEDQSQTAATAPNEAAAGDRITSTGGEEAAASPLDFGSVPEKYRDAVKRYFTPDDASITIRPKTAE